MVATVPRSGGAGSASRRTCRRSRSWRASASVMRSDPNREPLTRKRLPRRAFSPQTRDTRPAKAVSVERKPAQLVAQPLVVKHKFSDLVGELSALPLALQTACLDAVVVSRGRSRRPDRVRRGSEFVGCDMAHRSGLAGSVRGIPCCTTQLPGRGVCVTSRGAGLLPRDLTPRPGTPEDDRPPRTIVLRSCLLEVLQHMLRAVSRPYREKAMIVILEDPAATHCDEPRIADLGQDHRCRHPSPLPVMRGIRRTAPEGGP